jgi:hypothetical protein
MSELDKGKTPVRDPKHVINLFIVLRGEEEDPIDLEISPLPFVAIVMRMSVRL